ncbi:MAG: hypothetical protein ACKOGA_15775 [Planctomycetaceae bacterium]
MSGTAGDFYLSSLLWSTITFETDTECREATVTTLESNNVCTDVLLSRSS